MNQMEQDIFPFIGEKPIGEITTPELADLLQRIAIRTVETAHRLKMAIGQLFQYAVIKGMCINNPAASLRGVLPVRRHKHMAAPTESKAVAELLCVIESFNGTFIVKCALQLAPLLFVRPGELRAMEWKELDLEMLDCSMPQWNIPGSEMKMRQPHTVFG